jgi:pyruvate formate-lyase/glycerol dehydratase family glycyl radical enzyme
MSEIDPRVARLKQRLLNAAYEICMARALHFTRAYRESEGMDPNLRNAFALERTLENQKIFIYPDEFIAGSKTERFLAGPLSVERGDLLRALQMEIEILAQKKRPFYINEKNRQLFWNEIFPYWDGRSLRDRKAALWEQSGIIDTGSGPIKSVRRIINLVRLLRGVDKERSRKIFGANLSGPLTLKRIRNLYDLRFEYARNNPTPAIFCFDVQGHLSLGVDKVVERGMGAIIEEAGKRRQDLDQRDEKKRAFLDAVIISLEAACRYAERFSDLAGKKAGAAESAGEKRRLLQIAENCRRVPRHKPETFQQALQAAWLTLMIGEIQYGTHEVFAVGRIDQYLYPFYRDDMQSGRLTRELAVALLQEFFIKQTSNVDPIPELGMETNAVLGNSQHVAVIGGVTTDGRDACNELSYVILEAFERMNGSLNQLSVRIAEQSPPELLRRTAEVFRTASGIAVYNDEVIIPALVSDGFSQEDARDYCIVGCIETSGQSDTHGCPGGHELVLPAVLAMTLSRGKRPIPAPGQKGGVDCGDPAGFDTFSKFTSAFRRQLKHQVDVLLKAVEGKDRAYREFLPAPFVSALMDDCILSCRDITDGGARYDFTSLDVRGLATLVDSLLAVKQLVYDKQELTIEELIRILDDDYQGHEALRLRIINRAPKYGIGDEEADRMAQEVIGWIHKTIKNRRNVRGGRYRVCYYSYGNHVIDGLLLGATPDGRKAGEPISNGVSPSNLFVRNCGPQGPLKSAARIPAEQASSGVSLNMRFHPGMLKSEQGVETFARMIRTYFGLGGMHIQPNVVSAETLRSAQKNPDRYKDLVVKVSGYSAYFCDLGKSIQEDIIARCEFGPESG